MHIRTLSLCVLLTTGCLEPHPAAPNIISGTMVAGRFERSVLGSGDRYSLTIQSCVDTKEVDGQAWPLYRYCRRNDPAPRVQKTFVLQWPESTRMLESGDFPRAGDRFRFALKPHVDPRESGFYVHATLVERSNGRFPR